MLFLLVDLVVLLVYGVAPGLIGGSVESPFALSLHNLLDKVSYTASSAREGRNEVAYCLDLCNGIGRADGKTTTLENRNVWKVIAHISHFFRIEVVPLAEIFKNRELVLCVLDNLVSKNRVEALENGIALATGNDGQSVSAHIGKPHSQAVLGVERADKVTGFRYADNAAVREHAVNVKGKSLDILELDLVVTHILDLVLINDVKV